MSDNNSAAPSPPKPNGGGGLKSRIAAFESGAASNASKGGSSREIPHANLSKLRQRFDKEGDKPLVVKGSFGMGAPPLANSDGSGMSAGPKDRAVSLGGGRAVSPMQSPTVMPTPRSISTAASVSHSTRPASLRSQSNSSASTAISSLATSTSSLLPGPLAAARAQGSGHSNSPYVTLDDTSGLRTPMSSISLSSMAVEAGSTGDGSSATVEGNDRTSQPDTPLENNAGIANAESENPEGKRADSSTLSEDTPLLAPSATNPAISTEGLSAYDFESQQQEGGASTGTIGEVALPVDAVQRAQEELERYEQEEPSASATAISPAPEDESPSINVPKVDVQDTSAKGRDLAAADVDKASSLPAVTSPLKRTSLTSPPPSLISPRLRRSSTGQSIASSHPESDLAETNLETFDNENLSAPGPQQPAQQMEAGPEEPDAPSEIGRARQIGESIAPLPAEGTDQEPSDAPVASPTIVAETANIMSPSKQASGDDSPNRGMAMDDREDATEAGESPDLDEVGLPKVKCSDCGDKVSVLALGEHACAPSAANSPTKVALPTSMSDQRSPPDANINTGKDNAIEVISDKAGLIQQTVIRDGIPYPDDVPTSDFSPSPSPQRGHQGLPPEQPDVPDDERESVRSGENPIECESTRMKRLGD